MITEQLTTYLFGISHMCGRLLLVERVELRTDLRLINRGEEVSTFEITRHCARTLSAVAFTALRRLRVLHTW